MRLPTFPFSAAAGLMLSLVLAGSSYSKAPQKTGAQLGAQGKPRLPLIQRDISVAKASSNKMTPLGKAPSQLQYELCLSTKSFKNDNTADQDNTPAVFDLLCYNEQPVGPVLRMRRGTTVKVHLTNLLQAQKDPGFDPGLPSNSLLTAETPHGLALQTCIRTGCISAQQANRTTYLETSSPLILTHLQQKRTRTTNSPFNM